MKNELEEKGRASIFIGLMTILIVLFSSIARAQSTKVLFLGNSFTYTYDIPSLFSDIAANAGESVLVDEYTQPGIAVYDDQVAGHINDASAQAKIVSQQWDYIIVQDNMGGWVYDFIAAGPANANVTLYNQIKANNPCTRIIYFSAWGPEGGVPQLGYSGENTQNCNNRIFENWTSFNDQAPDEIVSPIGKAWNQSLYDMPSVDLYYSDNVHPSLEGSYLAALTLFTSVFKIDPNQLSYNGGVSSSTANIMKSIAWDVVMDPALFMECNLDTYTPTITQNNDDLTASGFSSYQWYLNGALISGANSSTYTALEIGTYTVIGFDTDGCASYSFEHEVTSVSTGGGNNGVSIDEDEISPLSIYPNPAIDFVKIQLNAQVDIIIISDVSGRIVTELRNIEGSSIELNIASWKRGLYFVQSISEIGGTQVEHLIVQ